MVAQAPAARSPQRNRSRERNQAPRAPRAAELEQSIRRASAQFGFSIQALDFAGLKAFLDIGPVALGTVPQKAPPSEAAPRKNASAATPPQGAEGAWAGEPPPPGALDAFSPEVSGAPPPSEVTLSPCPGAQSPPYGVAVQPGGCNSSRWYDSDPGFRATKSAMFTEMLEKELRRIDETVRQKLQQALQRTARAVQEATDFSRAAEGMDDPTRAEGVSLIATQLSQVYDDVVLVLWFTFLNSVSAAEIVDQFNSSLADADHKYVLDGTRWCFLDGGVAQLRAARRDLESANREVAALSDSASARSAELGGQCVRLIDDSLRHLLECNSSGAGRSALCPAKSCAEERKAHGRQPHAARRHAAHRGCEAVPQWRDTRMQAAYKPARVVGHGAYGVVTEAKCRATGGRVAVKTITDAWAGPVLAQRAYREALVLLRLRHPHIIPLHDIVVDSNGRDLHLVFPLARQCAERAHRMKLLLPVHRSWIVYQLLHALAYLHARGVVHRDLKLSNLLLLDRATLLLADFGSARTLADGCTREHMTDNPDYIQTQWYRAPEVLLCAAEVTTAADMWSVGCIAAELITGVPIFPGQDPQHQLELVLSYTGIPGGATLEAMRSPLAPLLLYQAGYTQGPSAERNSPRLVPQGRRGRQAPESAGAALLPCRTLDDLLRCRDGESASRSSPSSSSDTRGNAAGSAGTGDEAAGDLIQRCLLFAPKERITARRALRHRWFGSVPQQAREKATEAAAGALEAAKSETGTVTLPLSCTRLCTVLEYKRGVELAARELRQKAVVRQPHTGGGKREECACTIS